MKTEIDVKLTPDQLAEMFIQWGNDEQGKFINLVGEHFKKCDFSGEMQCCAISDEVNKNGKDFIYTMANFLKVQKFTDKSKHYNMLINTFDHDTLRGANANNQTL